MRAICARCVCAWQTRPFRPPGLSRELDRKPATSITGKQTGDTDSKPAISIPALELGVGALPTLTALFSRIATPATKLLKSERPCGPVRAGKSGGSAPDPFESRAEESRLGVFAAVTHSAEPITVAACVGHFAGVTIN